MRRLSGKLTPRGAFIEVQVSPSPQLVAARRAVGEEAASVGAPRALLDTGADASAVDSRIIRALGLRATGASVSTCPAMRST